MAASQSLSFLLNLIQYTAAWSLLFMHGEQLNWYLREMLMHYFNIRTSFGLFLCYFLWHGQRLFFRRNLVALCPSLANGTSTTQLLLMDSQLYSTKPGMRKRLGMDKILNPLAKTPGLRGWNLMPPRQIQRSGFAAWRQVLHNLEEDKLPPQKKNGWESMVV